MKRPASFRPALQEWEIEQREIVTFNDFLAGPGGHGLGKELAHLGQHGKHFYFVEEALRGLDVHESADAVGDFIEGVDLERQIHAAGRTELIDQDLRAGMAFDVLEEEGGAAGDAFGDVAFCLRGRRFR